MAFFVTLTLTQSKTHVSNMFLFFKVCYPNQQTKYKVKTGLKKTKVSGVNIKTSKLLIKVHSLIGPLTLLHENILLIGRPSMFHRAQTVRSRDSAELMICLA